MNLNNLNLNEKIEDLLAALKKKEDEKEKNTVYLEAPRKLKAVDIKTMPYPVFQLICSLYLQAC